MSPLTYSLYTHASFLHADQCTFRIEVLPMKDVSKAIEGVWNGKARYRYVLVQDIEKH